MLQEKIISFLLNRDWSVLQRNDKFIELKPPAYLHLPESYTIAVPLSNDKVDFLPFITNVKSVVGELYETSKEELDAIIENEQTVLSIRVYDDETKDGKIPLLRFDELMDRMKGILLNAASFVINPDVTNTETPSEANKYLNLCQFLQTEKGSFVAKIQLPTKEVIIDTDMFRDTPILSEDVTFKVVEVLDFVTSDVFRGNFELTPEFVRENESKLNLKLLKGVEALYEKVDLKNIDFTFSNISTTSVVKSQNVTKEQVSTLSDFIKEVSNIIFEIVEVEFTGKVLTLKSKDPDGLKNKIEMKGILEHSPFTASASLDSEAYKTAIEAHKFKKYMKIRGIAKKSKSALRFIDIFEVSIVE